MIKILLTGPTGYIGGSVLTRLLSHPLSDTFRITLLVRNAEKASQFRSMGMCVVVGTYSHLPLLSRLSEDADIIFACADADDEPAARAILEGSKLRFQETGNAPSLIHTSGTGVLSDDAQGKFMTDIIYSDLDIPKLETLPITQPHRSVDMALVEADKAGYVKTYIILPCTIYGIATGPLVDALLQNAHSQQIPRLVRLSVERCKAGMVGQGKNIWDNVHIHDVTELYIRIFELIVGHEKGEKYHHAPKDFEHGASGFYFCENGEHTLYAVGEAIGNVMVDRGMIYDPRPAPFTEEEMARFFPAGTSLGSNSRCKADRARAVGWKPHQTTLDMLSSIKHEFKH